MKYVALFSIVCTLCLLVVIINRNNDNHQLQTTIEKKDSIILYQQNYINQLTYPHEDYDTLVEEKE